LTVDLDLVFDSLSDEQGRLHFDADHPDGAGPGAGRTTSSGEPQYRRSHRGSPGYAPKNPQSGALRAMANCPDGCCVPSP
jgi:hypothetical protein